MAARPRRPRRKLTRADYARGLPDYHDPTAGFGGAAPTYSALTLRLWVAGFGVVFCTVAGILWLLVANMTWLAIVMFVIAFGLLIDFGWVVHRKRRGEPG
ncbi:MAG: hypothetical protein ACRDQ7_12115 [Haloechinothrix sp.]